MINISGQRCYTHFCTDIKNRQNNLRKLASMQPYLFVFIQVNSTMLLGDLRKLDTDITVLLPVKTT